MSWANPYYSPVTLPFWDGSQQVLVVYNGVANLFFTGYIWPLGWWGVSAPERGTVGIYALRSAGGLLPAYAWARIDDDTAVRGVHYQFQNAPTPLGLPASDRYIKFAWQHGEIGPKGLPVQLLNVDADVRFKVTFVGTGIIDNVVATGFLRPIGRWTPHPPFAQLPSNYFVTILQRPDEKGVAGFLQPSFSFNESQTVQVPVYRQSGSVGAVSVNYHTENGTAFAGTDYEAASGTLSWADGESGPKNIPVQLNGVASDRAFRVVLDGPAGGVYLNPSRKVAEVTIVDVPAAPGRLAFDVNVLQGESGETLELVVRRIGGKNGEVTVQLDLDDGTAQAGTHYTDVSETLTFLDDDDAPQTVEVDLIGSEAFLTQFSARLHTPTGGAELEPGLDSVAIYVLPTDVPPVPIVPDLLAGEFLQYSRREQIEDPGALTRRDTLVNVLQQGVDGEIGWASGGSLYGGGSDYQTPGPQSSPTWRQKHRMSVRQILL